MKGNGELQHGITKRLEQLPAKPEDLARWILIGQAKLTAQLAAIKAISKIEDGIAAHAAALSDTQDLAEELLYAEARLGEMLAASKPNIESSGRGTIEKKPSLPESIDKKQSHYAQELHRHEYVIAKVVAEARERGEVPVRQKVLQEIKKNAPKLETPPLPEGKFNVIYADPPWKYGDTCETGGVQAGGAVTKYPVMSIAELCESPINNRVAQNAVLFLWVTAPLLDECWPVIKAWGFEYKASFVWDKVKHNRGHYNSVRHELLLICTRSSMLPESKELQDSVVSIERSSRHSQKPEEFRELIEKVYPSGKKLELFARKRSDNGGWTYWGDEII